MNLNISYTTLLISSLLICRFSLHFTYISDVNPWLLSDTGNVFSHTHADAHLGFNTPQPHFCLWVRRSLHNLSVCMTKRTERNLFRRQKDWFRSWLRVVWPGFRQYMSAYLMGLQIRQKPMGIVSLGKDQRTLEKVQNTAGTTQPARSLLSYDWWFSWWF